MRNAKFEANDPRAMVAEGAEERISGVLKLMEAAGRRTGSVADLARSPTWPESLGGMIACQILAERGADRGAERSQE